MQPECSPNVRRVATLVNANPGYSNAQKGLNIASWSVVIRLGQLRIVSGAPQEHAGIVLDLVGQSLISHGEASSTLVFQIAFFNAHLSR